MNLAAKFDTFLETLIWGGPVKQGPGLPPPPVQKASKPVDLPKQPIKYTDEGLPYIEEKPQGNEVSAWSMINAETVKSAGRTKLGTSEEIEAGVAKGFSPETVALVRLHWADGKQQAAIAKATGFSLDTVKKITPIFSRGAKT